ncbi:hypothetical protein RBH29_17790, partial [Herbivorax sp. ANBcel31]|nr:hypothetical protein [Herbivorax sp. ANBcel31]
TGIKSTRQNGICEIVVGILRSELLNHIIPFYQKHLEYFIILSGHIKTLTGKLQFYRTSLQKVR